MASVMRHRRIRFPAAPGPSPAPTALPASFGVNCTAFSNSVRARTISPDLSASCHAAGPAAIETGRSSRCLCDGSSFRTIITARRKPASLEGCENTMNGRCISFPHYIQRSRRIREYHMWECSRWRRSRAGAGSHGPGTLDTTSQLLLDLALIEEVEGTDAVADHESRRRYYRLTGTDKVRLETEIGHIDSIVRLARRRKLTPEQRSSLLPTVIRSRLIRLNGLLYGAATGPSPKPLVVVRAVVLPSPVGESARGSGCICLMWLRRCGLLLFLRPWRSRA